MDNGPVDLDHLAGDLRHVEKWLTNTLGVSVDEADARQPFDPFAPPDDLENLKIAIDRIRPLLWLYVTRQNEARSLNARKLPAGARTLVDETLSITDRYARKTD
jgi:hypothetical protein